MTKRNFIIAMCIMATILVAGSTYAYLAFAVTNSVAITGTVKNISANMTVELVSGQNHKLVPLQDAALSNAINGVGSSNGNCIDVNGNNSCQVYKITLTNTGSPLSSIKGTVNLYAETGSTYYNLKWTLLDNATTVNGGNSIHGMPKSTMVSNVSIGTNESLTYYIAVWVSEIDGDQTNTDKGSFHGTVTFETEEITQISGENLIVNTSNAISDSTRDYTTYVTSANSHLYYTEDASTYGEKGQKIYYYAGTYDDVDNWVIFAGYCWRIIRTTSTGGTKLIYSGTPTGNSCASNTQNGGTLNTELSAFSASSDNPAHLLWQGQNISAVSISNWSTSQLNTMIQSTTDNDSIIKDKVKTWYNTNIAEKGYESKLEDMNLCFNFKGNTSDTATTFSDLTVTGTQKTFYATYIRSILHPSYNCSDGVTITSKYGLISVDEASYGGVVRADKTYSNTAWMVDTSTSGTYWTLSPSGIDQLDTARVAFVYHTGALSNSWANAKCGVRPSVSLSSNILPSSGDGTIETPFVIN